VTGSDGPYSRKWYAAQRATEAQSATPQKAHGLDGAKYAALLHGGPVPAGGSTALAMRISKNRD